MTFRQVSVILELLFFFLNGLLSVWHSHTIFPHEISSFSHCEQYSDLRY